ncbi:MAG: hypothetical protein J6386_09085 [Candidatus Synoicihabitans palmerolidicus]|nr:hypothetical protein [Candidatus Synoicihabitans palmerolidicus]
MVNDTLFGAAYIGSFVVRRSLWLEREALAAPHYGTDFAHVVRLYGQPMTGSTAVIGPPGTMVRLGVSLWMQRGFKVWAITWSGVVWALPAVTDAARERATSREPWRQLFLLVRMRVIGSFSSADYQRWVRPQQLSPRFRFIAWLISHTPSLFVNRLASLFLRLFRPDRRYFRAEIKAAAGVLLARSKT